MAFLDALIDTVSIYSIVVELKTGDTIGQQVKKETLLYNAVPCRLVSDSSQGISRDISRTDNGKQESIKYSWVLQMKPEHNGANRGDKAVVDSKNYIITKKQEIRGTTSAIHHVVYSLEEAK